MKRNEELITTKFTIGDSGFSGGLNIDITENGMVTKRKGYNTFGEMVHVLWDINKRFKKNGCKSDFTITLPLKGIKPIYKKTYKI